MTRYHPHIAARLFNTPLLAPPEKAGIVAQVLMEEWGFEGPPLVDRDSLDARFVEPPLRAGPLNEAVLRRHGDGYWHDDVRGIAQIDVNGMLVHKSRALRAHSGEQGYDGLGAQLDAALANNSVRDILMDFHSPGGEVSGLFGLADRVYQARSIKPIVAVVDDMALSAAYCLASACDDVWIASETARVGSIGAVYLHKNMSGQLAKEGVKVTMISAGARKTEGNALEPLPEEVRERIQAEVSSVRDQFAARVARNREISLDAVMATEAATIVGQAAVEIGLASGIMAPAEVYQRFADRLSRPQFA